MSKITRKQIMTELNWARQVAKFSAENETDTLHEAEINALWHLHDVLKDVIQLMEYEGRAGE